MSTVTTPEGVVRKTLYDDTTGGVARQRVKEQQIKPAGGSAFITQAAYAYYPLGAAREGLLHTLTNAESATTIYTYDAAGRVLTQTGTASYPLRYDYDALGRLWKLHTYRGTNPNLEEDGDVTTWNYHPVSGNLASKRDAANKGASYTYTAAGQLHTRTWQRGIVTTYGYDAAGRLKTIDYDDSITPDVSYGYDRAGRRTRITDAAGEHTLTYAGTQPHTWTVAAGTGPWAGLSVDYGITAGRRTGRTTSHGGITLPAVSYTYAPASGELESVTSADITATYRRSAATGWNEGLTYTQGGSTKLTSTRTAGHVAWANAANTALSSHDYTLDEMNRRTHALRQDGSQWVYGYNLRGEVTSAAKEDATEIPEPGKQYTYAFDGLGNRTSSTVSSLADHEVTRSTGYAANELNQYTGISHPSPGWLVQRGSARTEATVSVDGEPPTLRFGQQWHDEKSVDNSVGAVRRVTEIIATRPDGGVSNGPVTARQKGSRFIPPPLETITHDEDGNQTTNAQWTYTWDGENRLIAAEENTSVHLQPTGTTPVQRQKLEFGYDSQGRRIAKRVLLAEAGSTTFVLKQGIVFLYDGWNMIAEIDITQNTPKLLRSYEWGLDMSETMDEAGGVGGLLVERFHSATSSSAHTPCYDGNGNVVELVSLTSSAVVGRYEYGSFGETINVEGGVVADANPVRFSTKYWDGETGLLYYTHRYYDVTRGRWVNRDTLEEYGGLNLYGLTLNDLVNYWDYLGFFYPAGTNWFPTRPPPSNPGDYSKGRAIEWFKSWFPHPLQKSLIHHYGWNNGREFSLTEEQMGWIQGDINLFSSEQFREEVYKLENVGSIKLNELVAQGFTASMHGTLGQFSVVLNGMLCQEGEHVWVYHGTIRFKDTYDFDPQPLFGGAGQTSRSLGGGVKNTICLS